MNAFIKPTEKTACFFARVKRPEVLNRRQWYGNDIKILESLGFKVIIATKFRDIPWNCDLYFSWFTTGSILPLIKAKLMRRPIIVIAGGDEVVAYSHGYFSKPWYARFCILFCVRYADAVLAVSNAILDQLIKLGARNPILIYNAVDTENFKSLDCPKDAIVSVIRQDQYTYEGKKIELLLQAMACVIKIYPKQKFTIIGENGTTYEKTKSFAENLGICDHIEFLGALNNHDVLKYFQRAFICLQPTRYEAFGFAIAEAMSCQIPVITSRVGAVPEIVGDCGLYISNDDPKDFADKIIFLIENRTAAMRLGMAARKRIEKYFTYDQRKNKIKEVIEKINKTK